MLMIRLGGFGKSVISMKNTVQNNQNELNLFYLSK